MRYQGSKRLLAKHILPIILADRKPGQWYVEPFVGGANSFQLVDNPKLGADVFPPTIQALQVIRDRLDTLPEVWSDLPKDLWREITNDVRHPLHGYVSIACAFGGKYKGGYIKRSYGSDYIDRIASQYRAAIKTSKLLQGAGLVCVSYKDLLIPPNSIIYCDPPYKGTTGYKPGAFDREEFWQWCRCKKQEGHTIFISEYEAPEDFKCVFEKEHNVSLNDKCNNKKSIEKLFTL